MTAACDEAFTSTLALQLETKVAVDLKRHFLSFFDFSFYAFFELENSNLSSKLFSVKTFLLLLISDLVNWITENVEGIQDRREARKFIGNMLRKNYIKHTVNKLTFSENSYYQFGEGDSGGSLLNEDDGNNYTIDILDASIMKIFSQQIMHRH